MKKTQCRPALAIGAGLILATQTVAAQERSEEYEEGYRDGMRDALCPVVEQVAPLLPWLAPVLVAADPELSMADITAFAEECGIAWQAVAPVPTPQLTPEPADSARCERLAALIESLDAEIDRLLAASTDIGTSLEIQQAQSRRNDIEGEMSRAGC